MHPKMSRNNPSHVLVFEPDYRGHQREYIQHLCNYVERIQPNVRLSFLVHPTLYDYFSDGNADAQVEFLAIDADDSEACISGSPFTKDRARWACARDGVKFTGADHTHFLQIDEVQLSLALGRSLAQSCTVSGILFRPTIHYKALWEHGRSWNDYWRDMRKAVLYNAMLLNPRLTTLLTLDPYFANYANAHLINGKKVGWVCDPMKKPSLAGTNESSHIFREDRTNFLLFGSLAERKGIFQVLDALDYMSPEMRNRILIAFAGRLRDKDRDRFIAKLREVKKKYPKVVLRLDDRFLPENELTTWISQADVILAPYQRAMGSSGVVLWACALEKPILTQDYGLIGAYVRDHGLGHTVDTTSPASIAQGISRFVSAPNGVGVSCPSSAELMARHHPDRFAETILDTISKSAHVQFDSGYQEAE